MSIYNLDTAPVYGIDGTAADSLRLRDGDNSEVMERDQIIWVEDNDGDIAFIIDITDSNYADGDGRSYDTPTWLKNIYSAMLNHQRTTSTTTPSDPETPDLYLTAVNIKGVTGDNVEIDNEAKTVTATIPYDNWAVNTSAQQLTATSNKGTVKLFSADGTSFTSGTAVLASTQTKFYAQIADGRDMVEYTINLTLSPAATGASLTSLFVKGIEVELPAEAAQAVTPVNVALSVEKIGAADNKDEVQLKMTASPFATVAVAETSGTDTAVVTSLDQDGDNWETETANATTKFNVVTNKSFKITVTSQDTQSVTVYTVTLKEVRDFAGTIGSIAKAGTAVSYANNVLTVPAGVTVNATSAKTFLTWLEAGETTSGDGNATTVTTVEVKGDKIILTTKNKTNPDATDANVTEITWKNADITLTNKKDATIYINGEPAAKDAAIVVPYDSDVVIEVPGVGGTATLNGTKGDDYTDFKKDDDKSTSTTTYFNLTGIVASMEISD